MREFDTDAFIERAAICEYCAGMTRFEAETAAAQAQGVARWQAIKLVKEADDANGRGPIGGSRDQADQVDRKRNADDLPRVQRQPEEENRSVSERVAQAGWAGVVLLALFAQGWAFV